MTQERKRVVDSVPRLLKDYLDTNDQNSLDAFNKAINEFSSDGDFETVLQIYEEAIRMFPDNPRVYYGAVKACKHWSDKMAGDYFDSKNVLGMDFKEWRFGKGTPYRQFVELRHKAADYLEKVIELSPDLTTETVAAIREDIFDLRYH